MAYAQGKYDAAEPMLERAVAIYRAAFGADHPGTQTITANYVLFLVTAPATPDRAARLRALLAAE